MQSRTTNSLVTSLLLSVVACAVQNAGAGVDDPKGGDSADAGPSKGGEASTAGSSSISISGSAPVSTAGKTSSGSGGSETDLPPAGSGGKTSSGSGGKGGKASTAGTGGGAAEGGAGPYTGPANMPIVGLSVTFAPDSKADPADFLGGELDVINDTAQPLTLSDLKIRYYFSDEITAATPSVMMNWAQFGPKANLGGATCTGTINKAATPAPGADSYIELTCSGASGTDLTAGTLLKISWKAGAQGMGKFIQADDWSFSDPTKIVVLNGNTIVWGIEPG